MGKSHKAIDKERPWILRFYYVVPYSLFVVCLLNETWIFSNYMLYLFFLLLYLFYSSAGKGMILEFTIPIWKFFNIAFLPVFAFKQIVSLVALFDSSKSIIQFDEEERAAKKD